MLKIDVVSNIPTPNNEAFFAALGRLVNLRVLYEGPARTIRPWKESFVEGYESVVHSGVPLGLWGVWDPRLPRSLRRNADIVILGGSYYSPTVAYLLRSRSRGALRVFWGERFRTVTGPGQVVRKQLLGRADCLLAAGDRAAAQYRAVTVAPVHVLPYSCAVTPVACDPSPDRIGFIGQLIERKGLDLLFAACAAGSATAIDVVGSGPLEGRLREQAAAADLEVAWHGEQPNAALPRLRSRWALQVVPSRYDGWGVVVNEALGAGVPVVVSSATGAVELVRDGVNGWHHEGGDASSLCGALTRARDGCCSPSVRRAAAVTGRMFGADAAAEFLATVLPVIDKERSFLAEQWLQADALLHQ